MGRYDDNGPGMPPKIKAAFEFLYHTRLVTEQTDASIPMRALSPLERSVEVAALRTVHQYLMGEMDFAEPTPPAPRKADGDGDDDSANERVGSPR